MKIVQTFWIDNEENPLSSSFGWCSPKFHLMSWALSCLQLNKFYGDIELITNSKGKEILIDVLNLPYKRVRIELDEVNFNSKLWVLKKIYSYTLHNEPFLNIDGDVYIFKELPPVLLSGELISQNIEEGFWYYNELLNLVNSDFDFVPSFLRYEQNNSKKNGANAGVLGGLNNEFFFNFYSIVNEFVIRNENAISILDPNMIGRFNIFLEQFFFYSLANKNNIEVKYLLKPVDDPGFDGYANFHYLPNDIKFIHLLGDFKKNTWVCDQLSKRLFLNFPSFHSKIESIFLEDFDFKSNSRGKIYDFYLSKIIYNLKPEPFENKLYEDFFRTLKILELYKVLPDNISSLNEETIFHLVESSKKIIKIDNFSHLIDDVFNFEVDKQKIINLLINSEQIFLDNFKSFHTSNFTFSNNDWRTNSYFKLTSLAFWIESKWDWAHNSFSSNIYNIDKILKNFNQEPEYFVTILLLDSVNFNLIEYLLNPIEVFLLSSCYANRWISTNLVFEHAKCFFQNLESDVIDSTLEDSLRFLSYSGIIQFKYE